MAKKVLKIIGIVLLAIILAFVGFLGACTLLEYRPDDVEELEMVNGGSQRNLSAGDSLSLLTFNIGYGALGAGQDFFMDGGDMVRPESEFVIEGNLGGIFDFLSATPADAYLIQEADINSKRSYHINEVDSLISFTQKNGAFAYNFNSLYTPYPLPTIGKVESGLLTLTDLDVREAQRVSLPVPFSWPVSLFNLKRCLLVERIPVGERELVLVNLHLEAYDDGEGKREQTEVLMGLLTEEYRKGNYVIAGGDFNQMFPDSAYPEVDTENWVPGELDETMLPEGWQFAYDASTPTCRLLNKPYSGSYEDTQLYVIDGYILSPNVQLDRVQTIDLDFQYSDHHPVLLEATLQ
ncbi:endonuclease [Christensenellaceae bacterium OttesenSCG-928-K19]|nr:endonuclease [Christensenellaceae bacterium OttesenSCG-928-K19]